MQASVDPTPVCPSDSFRFWKWARAEGARGALVPSVTGVALLRS